ncbi:MAG: hypothetical protein GXO50_01810 [Chlorobi bacterium]|nr:hypothetical protein [Chlorobiota bacterium]
MKNLIYLLLVMSLIACSKEENTEQFIIDTDIDISLKDDDGNDLLDPNNTDSYDENTIKIIYEVNGEQFEFYDEKLDAPKGFFIYQHENEYRLRLFPNISDIENYPVTYIKWNESDTDTIKCLIERKFNSEICRKVWFNDKVVWESYDTDRYFEIIKN